MSSEVFDYRELTTLSHKHPSQASSANGCHCAYILETEKISTGGEKIGGTLRTDCVQGLPTANPRPCSLLCLSPTKRKPLRKRNLLILEDYP